MSDEAFDTISRTFVNDINRLVDEGFSEVDILKALSFVLYEFVESFEEVGDECDDD